MNTCLIYFLYYVVCLIYKINTLHEVYEPDKTLERIRNNIFEYANLLYKTDKNSINKKRILVGDLPDSFPDEMKKKAQLYRQDKSNWENVMLYPTSIWRVCIFPSSKINYISYCKSKLGLDKIKTKLDGCLHNFCTVCCDHLQYHYRNIANKDEIGSKFLLSNNKGFDNIKYVVTPEEINQCRNGCNKHYKIEIPIILPSPPRDPNLGTSTNNPAISCADIKKWGHEMAKTGQYWIEIKGKGLFKVFCDMETDHGGWTLFYSYNHFPGQELTLDSSKLPSSPEDNSHMHLSNAGFYNQDVKEIRFFCYEKFKDNKYYWHFKTDNDYIIQTALTGDQQSLRSDSLSKSYKELKPPYEMNGIYRKRIYESMITSIDEIGIDPKGGFTNTPFGSSRYSAFWTIKGNSLKNPIYECATQHRYIGGFSTPNSSPNMVETHHTIWFRGDAPDEEVVQKRLLNILKREN